MITIEKKYCVAITVEVWQGEPTIARHYYDTEEQAQAVYERVNAIYAHKGYACADEGNVGTPYGDGMCCLWEKDERECYNIEIYPEVCQTL